MERKRRNIGWNLCRVWHGDLTRNAPASIAPAASHHSSNHTGKYSCYRVIFVIYWLLLNVGLLPNVIARIKCPNQLHFTTSGVVIIILDNCVPKETVWPHRCNYHGNCYLQTSWKFRKLHQVFENVDSIAMYPGWCPWQDDTMAFALPKHV